MSIWQNIVTNALLGTERQAFVLASVADATGGALGELLTAIAAQTEATDQERALLQAAAVVALHHQAGRNPAEVTAEVIAATPTPCERDELPACHERAARHLALMLGGEYREALDEWLTALAARQQRVPALLLPALLDYGATNKSLREAIVAVIGKRGVWLAAQNPAWGYAQSLQEPQETWQTGSREDRLLALKMIRQADAQRGRACLAESWKAEAADDRARFLALFKHGLSMEDEPFLEAALDDKRKEVRRTATDLLLRLPQSQLCRRQIERAVALVRYEKNWMGRGRLEVTLPEGCDKAMQRDGIDAAAPQQMGKMGERAWWLAQIIAAVPLSVWRDGWQMQTDGLVKLIRGHEWENVFLYGWSQAAARSGDVGMAKAILDLWVESNSEFLREHLESLVALARVLPMAGQQTLFFSLIQEYMRSPKDKGYLLGFTHQILQGRWDEAMTRAVLDFLRPRASNSHTPGVLYLLTDWGYRLEPLAALPLLDALFEMPGMEMQARYFEKLFGALRHRRDMLAALAR